MIGAYDPAIDSDLGELVAQGEQDVAKAIAEAMRQHVAQTYPRGEGPARRDAHPKAHGCVRAEFCVDDVVPEELAQGVFVPGKSYKAWVRFSNGDGNPKRPDSQGDSHGMAIKLLGVPGEKILPDERSAQTHDFLMIDHPVFIIDDPRRYLTLIERSNSSSLFKNVLAPLALGLRGALIARAISSNRIRSLLGARYWSTTAYRLGCDSRKIAVKYSARPSVPSSSGGAAAGADYLRERLIADLSQREARFDFLVQPRTAATMSVERSTIEWKEEQAPFHKVATLIIPKQVFAVPAQDEFGEALSFTPWHALPEHRPLGGVNRVRRVVYEEISRFRHTHNGAARSEPLDDSILQSPLSIAGV